MILLKDIKLEDKKLFDLKINHLYSNSEASFANLFMWRKLSKTKFALIDDALVVFYTKSDGRMACCFPFGATNLYETLEKMRLFFKKNNNEFIMESVPEECVNLIKNVYDNLDIYENADLNDYVYFSEKLINLSGKKLHAKRNHINKFKSLYSYEYKKITKEIADSCLVKAKEWLLTKYTENILDFNNEMTALTEVLSNYDALQLTGGAILVNSEIIAFSIGEKLTDDTFVTHIEKADTNFHGAYTIMNNEFAINECSEFTYINREEDMGIDGIRKAKLSYYPDKMIKKYTIRFKEN